MQGSANVSLSAFEKELVMDANWILTKNHIIQKVFALFGLVSDACLLHPLLKHLPNEITATAPKISKGENYEGLPYVMLDYPRCFSKDDVFAIRTFFWWGNFFSITLHLKGKYKLQYEQVITDAIKAGELKNAWVNVSDHEWMHHFENKNMRPVDGMDANTLKAKELLKLAYKLELKEWDNAEEFLLKAFDQYMQILHH
jgi:hypothetical protein